MRLLLSNNMKPLVKWSGGKSEEISSLERYFPAQYDLYLEPFVGGGSVFFHLQPQRAVISDVHQELVDFYQSIKDHHAQEIYHFMKTHPNTEETYYHVRDKMPILSPLDNAKRFYYLRKTCYRGMLRYNKNGGFNIPFGRYKTIQFEDIQDPAYTALLQRTQIQCCGFAEIFAQYNDPSFFMFLDPPYDSTFTDYGYCQFGKEKHEQLAGCIQNTRTKCLMVIGKTPWIEKLYAGMIVAEYPKQYRFRLHSGRVQANDMNTTHVVITNYKTG
jgi:DNA adenine methylase